jgi:hypothetical protein
VALLRIPLEGRPHFFSPCWARSFAALPLPSCQLLSFMGSPGELSQQIEWKHDVHKQPGQGQQGTITQVEAGVGKASRAISL